MNLRVVPPAHSVLPLGAIAAGARALVIGGAHDLLQTQLRDRFDAEEVFLTDCGTAALRVAIGICVAQAPKHPVALPAWACFDVLSAAIGARADILFYDIDPDTLGPSEAALDGLARETLAAIVVVHAFGNPVDIPAVRAALRPQTPVIEDAAQAWGATVSDRHAGTFGDLAVLSFSRGKGITGGSGGALLRRPGAPALPTASPASLSARRGVRDVAACAFIGAFSHPRLYCIPAALPWLRLGETHYRPPREVGAMSHAATATVRAALEAASSAADRRGTRGMRLRDAVGASPIATNVAVIEGARPSWLRLPAVVADPERRHRLLRDGGRWGVAATYPRPLTALAAELGVRARVLGEGSGAGEIARTLVTLPTHDYVTEADQQALRGLLEAP